MKKSQIYGFRYSRYNNTGIKLQYAFSIVVHHLLVLIILQSFVSCSSNIDQPPPPFNPCQNFSDNLTAKPALTIEPILLIAIEGIVRNHNDSCPIPDVAVSIDWTDSSTVVTSDSLGYYLIQGPICPGDYEITFTAPDFVIKTVEIHTPTSIDETKGDIYVSYNGIIIDRIELDVELFSQVVPQVISTE